MNPIEIEGVRHSYGGHKVYDDLSLRFAEGKIYGLLGKNGVGKTTLIKILMGFLNPLEGECRIFGESAHTLSPKTRQRVALLFERHLAYDFFSIKQIEQFYAPFYPRWKKENYYALVDLLHLPDSHLIRNMSEGQRSQVVLGLMLAQDADLLILDDYSMGLDAGYRRLFIDYLQEYLQQGKRTVVLTSHVIQDMNSFIDEVVFLERGGNALHTSLEAFMRDFSLYRLSREGNENLTRENAQELSTLPNIKNVEMHNKYIDIFSFASQEDVTHILQKRGIVTNNITSVPMDMEDAFIGYTGRY